MRSLRTLDSLMSEHLYNVPSWVIAGVLLASMAVAKECGYRVGLRRGWVGEKQAKEHIHAIQNSILGILALLLGFTFSLALQRFDSRSEAVEAEASAIEGMWIRSGFLPAKVRDEARVRTREYLELRIQSGALSVAEQAQREALRSDAVAMQRRLTRLALEAAQLDSAGQAVAPFVEAVEEVCDSYRKRLAGLNRHVPEVVLLLLFGTFLVAGGIVGYAAGVAGHRPSIVSYLMVGLVVVLVFLILDLDRPRRGLIEVDQRGLEEVRAAMRD